MSVPAVDTSSGPPVRLPLSHVVVGFGFLLAGLVLGLLVLVGWLDDFQRLAPVHLLLLGWVCVTIMGAMEQFVPVWTGEPLYSRRLAGTALVLVAAGVTGMASAALAGRPRLLVLGLFAVGGLWLFVYDLLRTLSYADATQRHFAYALCALAVAAGLGGALALDFRTPLLAHAGFGHAAVRAAHVTLAVLGGVVLTVVGALSQLGPMFIGGGQAAETWLTRLEEATLPLGVLLLAGGRLVSAAPVARVGGALVVVGTLAFVGVLAREFVDGPTEVTPPATRYLLVVVFSLLWALLAASALVTRPLSTGVLGPPAATWALGAALAAVLVGTLYHVVPFLVWDRQYADRVGLEPVPMPDDLYHEGVARADLFGLTLAGCGLCVGAQLGVGRLVTASASVGAAALVLATTNLGEVLWSHRSVEEPPEDEGADGDSDAVGTGD